APAHPAASPSGARMLATCPNVGTAPPGRSSQPPPPPGSQGLGYTVSCPTTNACTAAGWRFTIQGGYVLAERWDGTRWTVQPTPLFAGDQDMNAAVACPTTSMCMAVGGQESPGPTAIPYAEQWTPGGQPTITRTPANSLQPPATTPEVGQLVPFSPTLIHL